MRLKKAETKRELLAAVDRSRRLLLEGRHEENCGLLQDAVRRFPNDAEIRLLYATTLLDARPDAVAQEAVKATELGRDNPRILVRAAHLLLTCGRVEEARRSATRAKELIGPEFVLMSDLINLEGLLAECDRQDDLAESKLQLAVESQPANGPFAIHLARFLVSRGRRDEAREVIDRALKLTKKPDNLERVRSEIVV